MKHVQFFSIALLFSCASQSYALNVSQDQLEITDRLGMVARKMVELKCLNPLLAPEAQTECETLNASYLSLSQELHNAINTKHKHELEKAASLVAAATANVASLAAVLPVVEASLKVELAKQEEKTASLVELVTPVANLVLVADFATTSVLVSEAK